MRTSNLNILGAKKVSFNVFNDPRGYFHEWFRQSEFDLLDLDFKVAQANFSESISKTLRGFHFSIATLGQSKLVFPALGVIDDVLIDLRVGSPTYLNVAKVALSSGSGDGVFIPSGVGHSFLVKSELAAVMYLVSSEYNPDKEFSLNPFDKTIDIDWGIPKSEVVLSNRDENAPSLAALKESGLLPQFK